MLRCLLKSCSSTTSRRLKPSCVTCVCRRLKLRSETPVDSERRPFSRERAELQEQVERRERAAPRERAALREEAERRERAALAERAELLEQVERREPERGQFSPTSIRVVLAVAFVCEVLLCSAAASTADDVPPGGSPAEGRQSSSFAFSDQLAQLPRDPPGENLLNSATRTQFGYINGQARIQCPHEPGCREEVSDHSSDSSITFASTRTNNCASRSRTP